MADVAEHHAERGRGLALAGPGVDDQQALLAGLGGHDLVARGLVLARFFLMAGIFRVVVLGRRLGHAISFWASGNNSAIKWAARLERGVHNPRRIASANLAAVSRNAAGLAASMKSRARSPSRLAANS